MNQWISVKNQMPEPYIPVWSFIPASKRYFHPDDWVTGHHLDDWVAVHQYYPEHVHHDSPVWIHRLGPSGSCLVKEKKITHWMPFEYPDPPGGRECNLPLDRFGKVV